jgi:hypothetical protein
MIRTASTPLQALAIPAGAAVLLFVLAGFAGGADAPTDFVQISDASSTTQQP